MSTVVLLCEKGAYWYRWNKHKLIAFHGQLFSSNSATPVANEVFLQLPDWDAHCLQGIELVIDSPAHEISVQLVAPSLASSLGFGDRRNVKRQLTKADKNQLVYRFGASDKYNGFLVHQFNCSPALVQWQSQLLLSAVTVQSVSSLNQKIITRCVKSSSHGLLVFLSNNQLKHLYIVNGQIVFARTSVLSNGINQIIESIEASFLHIAQQAWSVEKIELFSYGLNSELRQQLSSLSFSLGVTEISVESDFPQIAKECFGDEGATMSLPNGGENFARWLTPIAKEPFLSTLNHSIWTDSFRRRKLDKLANVVLVVVLTLLIISLLVLAYTGHEQISGKTELHSQESKLQQSIDELNEHLHHYSQAYRSVANIFYQAALIRHSVDVPISQILSAIALVLTNNNKLTLERLSWSVQALDVNESAEGVNATAWIVVLSGGVAADLSLKKQQAVFDAFLNQLKSTEFISHVEVENSPLHGIQKNAENRVLEGVLPAGYTIRFRFHG